tara:strand:+ start:1172 stop:1735 length:564 start_codon:yes stop_codon:yes gene_type:complete
MSDLDILPPDEAVFHKAEKKVSSNKQKEHLIKARAKARETIERRRMLDKQAKENKIEEEPEIEDEEEEEEIEQPKPKPKPKGKKVELTEEEQELRRFDKFMKNMNYYEQLKADKAREEEESKKIKISFSQEEYDELLKFLEEKELKEEKEQELKDAIPVAPKREEEQVTSVHHSLRPRSFRYNRGFR